jgi:ribose transport system permease protein
MSTTKKPSEELTEGDAAKTAGAGAHRATEATAGSAELSYQLEGSVPFFQRFMSRVGSFWTLGVLVLIVLLFEVLTPSMLTKAAWISTADYGVEYLILAVAETFVIITAGIDISVGAILGFSAMAGSVVMQEMLSGHNSVTAVVLVGIAIMLVTGLAVGLVNGLIISRWKLPPMIVTLGSMTAITGATDVLHHGTEITTLPNFVSDLGTTTLFHGWLPLPVLIALALTLVCGIILARTRFGLHTYAVGSNEVAARRSGIHVDRHLVYVYGLAGLLCGVAGLLVTADFSSASPLAGYNDEMYAIAACVIGGASLWGGRGTMFGTLIGTAIMSVLTTGLVLINVQAFWQQVAIGAIVVAAAGFDHIRLQSGDEK